VTQPILQGLLNANNPQTVITGTNLNALANNALVLGAAFSNVTGDGQGGGFRYARAKFHVDSMAVSAGGAISGWFLTASDGSVYEQGGTSVIPLRQPDFYVTPVVQTAAVDPQEQLVVVPICATIKCLLQNTALGAATPSNANGYLKLYYETDMYPSDAAAGPYSST
jgi:hypothetical protein